MVNVFGPAATGLSVYDDSLSASVLVRPGAFRGLYHPASWLRPVAGPTSWQLRA